MLRLSLLILIFSLLRLICGDDHSGYPSPSRRFSDKPISPESLYRYPEVNQPLPERPISPGSSYGYPGANRPFPERPNSPGSSYRYPERPISPGSSYGYPDDRRQLSELPKQTDSPFRFSGYNRLLAEKPKSQDCTFEGTPYQHGQRVATQSPCLNCTCTNKVVVCSLTVCVKPTVVKKGCFAAKAPTECCATLICSGTDDSVRNKIKPHSSPELRPTFKPTEDEHTINGSLTTTAYSDYKPIVVFDQHAPLDHTTLSTSISTENMTTVSLSTAPDNLSSHHSVYDRPYDATTSAEDMKSIKPNIAQKTTPASPEIYDGQGDTTMSAHSIKTAATLATPDSLSENTVTYQNTPTTKDGVSLVHITSTEDSALNFDATDIDEISGGEEDSSVPKDNSYSISHLRPFTFQHADKETTPKDIFTVVDYPTDAHAEVVNNHSGAPNFKEDGISVTTSVTLNTITSYPQDKNQKTLSTPISTENMTTASLPTTHDNLSPAFPEIYDGQSDTTVSTHNIKTVEIPSTPDSLSVGTVNYGSTPTYTDASSISSTFNANRQDGDSLVYITSTKDPLNYDDTLHEKISGGCVENGTIYGDGSAMLSNNFCEYCFCIRGKSKCIRPVCNLSIDGCTPIYETQYSCCPSKYDCSQRSTEATKSEQTTAPPTKKGNPKGCTVNGVSYQHGDLIPVHKKCHTCYCSNSNVSCERNQCTAPIDGCRPIIPKGFCCPISFRCDYDSGHMESAKDSAPNASKGSMISNQNIKNLHRRLDEADNLHLKSTVISVYETSPAYTGESSTTIYDDDSRASDPTRENDKTLNIELNGSTETILDTSTEKLVKEALTQTTAFQEGPSSTEAVSVGSPVVHTLSIQELFEKYFSHHNVNTSKLPEEAATEPKRNNSKQPISIVEIYDLEPDTTNSETTITTKLNTVSATNEKETASNESENQDTSVVTSSYTDSLNENTRIPSTIPVTYYEQGSSFYDEKKTENGAISTIFPSTETQNTEEFHTRTDNEPTYPVFTTTRKSNEFPEGFSTHPTLTSFVSREDLTDHDILEATLTQILTAASELYNEKFSTHLTSPDYATTKPSLSEELKIQTEARPVVFIYDSTPNFKTNAPTLHDQTSTSTDFLRDTTRNSFDGDYKTTYETQSPDFMFDTTQNLFTDHSTMESSSVEITTQNNNQELKTQSETRPTTPIYTTNINTEDQTTADITTNSDYSEQNKEETVSQLISMTHLYDGNSDKEHLTQAKVESTYPTVTTNKDTNTEDFVKEKDQTVYPIFTSTKFLNIGQTETKTGTNPTRQTTLTPEISTEKVNKVAEPVTSVFLPSEHGEGYEKEFTTVTIPLSTTNRQKDPITTESVKLSTRINSKLPSFNYVEKVNEKNGTSVYPQNPVLTDSVVTVYLPDDQERVPDKGNNFTNVGAVYIGAPLSVGGADSQKGGAVVKTKITQSGGVIFMDPKYTDINTKNSFRNSVKGANPASTQNWGSTVLPTTNIPNPSTTEKEPGNNEKKKGPRIQDAYNQSTSGQGYKIIPFVAEDAVRGHFGKINNTLVVQQGSTEGLPDIVSDFCFIKGRIYMNGEMIGKPDPCELCRCFYGRELCQIQRCPTPPDCTPEKIPGFCCPRFTCGNNATSNAQVNKEKEINPTGFVQISEVVPPSTRKPEIIERIPPMEDKEIKFGIRVRTRPTPSLPIKQTGYTEHKILFDKITTIKPEIRTFQSRTSSPRPRPPQSTTTTSTSTSTTTTTTTTTSKRPNMVHRSTSIKPEMKTTTTTTTASPLFPDPWGLLKVSGCNIYGKYYKINDQVEILSGPCSHCICTSNGVDCNDIC